MREVRGREMMIILNYSLPERLPHDLIGSPPPTHLIEPKLIFLISCDWINLNFRETNFQRKHYRSSSFKEKHFSNNNYGLDNIKQFSKKF